MMRKVIYGIIIMIVLAWIFGGNDDGKDFNTSMKKYGSMIVNSEENWSWLVETICEDEMLRKNGLVAAAVLGNKKDGKDFDAKDGWSYTNYKTDIIDDLYVENRFFDEMYLKTWQEKFWLQYAKDAIKFEYLGARKDFNTGKIYHGYYYVYRVTLNNNIEYLKDIQSKSEFKPFANIKWEAKGKPQTVFLVSHVKVSKFKDKEIHGVTLIANAYYLNGNLLTTAYVPDMQGSKPRGKIIMLPTK